MDTELHDEMKVKTEPSEIKSDQWEIEGKPIKIHVEELDINSETDQWEVEENAMESKALQIKVDPETVKREPVELDNQSELYTLGLQDEVWDETCPQVGILIGPDIKCVPNSFKNDSNMHAVFGNLNMPCI